MAAPYIWTLMNCIPRALLLLVLAFLFSKGSAQQVIVNSNGDRVIMYPDGSWRPVAPQDSLLIRQYLQKQEQSQGDGNSEVLNEGEVQNFLIRRGHALRSTITSQEKKVQNEFRIATNSQFKAAELLRAAEANKAVIEESRLEALKTNYDASVSTLRSAKLNQQAIKKLSTEANALVENPLQITRRKLDQLETKYNLYLSHYEPNATTTTATTKEKSTGTAQPTPVTPTMDKPAKENTTTSVPDILSHHRALETVPYERQPYKCSPVLDSIDEASGRKHVALAPETMFTHTDPDLRPFLKDRELITCMGNVWKIGPYTYLNVEFHISSSHSQSNFGALANGSLFRLKLFNDEYVSLYNLKSDKGHIDAYTGNTVFSGQYALGKDEIKKLRNSELDKIRVLWGTGYEDYDVYKVDFFFNQLDCLQSH